MRSINFETCKRTYAINGDENNVISVDLSDMNLPMRVKTAYDAITELIKPYEGRNDALTAEDFAILDAEVRKQIDYVFGDGVCEHAFGRTNCMSINTSGEWLFKAFFDAFLPVIMEDFEEIHKRRQKVEKYINPAKNTAPLVLDASKLTPEERAELLRQLQV